MRALRDRAYVELRAAGIVGGELFFHPFRLGNRWQNNREGRCEDGPHFHAIATGWVTPYTAESRDLGRWVVWNLGARPDNPSVYATAFYILTHLGVAFAQGNSLLDNLSRPIQSVTWFGTWSYARLVEEKPTEEGVRVEFCPVCCHLVPSDQVSEVRSALGDDPPGVPGSFAEGAWFAVTHASPRDLPSNWPEVREQLAVTHTSPRDLPSNWLEVPR